MRSRLLIRTAAVCLIGPLLSPLRAQTVLQSRPGPLTYQAALDLAASRNLGVVAARRQRAIREAAIRAAGQRPNPDVTFEITQDVPHELATFNLPVEIGGKRARRIDLAREELTLADLDVQTAMRLLRRNLRQSFYTVVATDEQMQVAESVVEIARRVRDVAQTRFEAGAVPRLEVMQADLGVTRAETELELVRSTRAAAQGRLNAVMNLPPQQPLVLAANLLERRAAPTYEQALAVATSSNVELIRLDREIAIEQRRVELLRADRIPTPVFSIGGVFNAPGELTAGVSAAIGIGLPIFSRNQGEIAASIATAAQFRAEREATQRNVDNDVYAAVARIDAQRRQLDAFQQRVIPTATELEALAEESYRAGRTSVLGVLDAQRSLRDARREALQAALDLQISLADLEELLGTALP